MEENNRKILDAQRKLVRKTRLSNWWSDWQLTNLVYSIHGLALHVVTSAGCME